MAQLAILSEEDHKRTELDKYSADYDPRKISRMPSLIELWLFGSIVCLRYSLLALRTPKLSLVVFLARPCLLLKPLSWQVWITSQAPVVIVVDSE